IGNYLSNYADVQTNLQKVLNDVSSSISLSFTKATPLNIGWLDNFVVNARRSLVVDQQFTFRDSRSRNPGFSCKYNISNPTGGSLSIWNVTDFLNPYIQLYNSS